MSEAIQEALRGWGIPPDLIVIILSALPVSELRGGIPAGFVLDMPVWRTFLFAVVANVLSVVPILLWAEPAARTLGRWPPLGRFFDWLFARARRKSGIVDKYGVFGLALFVAIPLPVTGAWTGSMIAVVLGLDFYKSLGCVILGVLIAGVVVTLASLGVITFLGLPAVGG
ncbi:MAG: small multi-drug export protein [Armatimonadota bacterium]|jgi:uncharacterized membrane protein